MLAPAVLAVALAAPAADPSHAALCAPRSGQGVKVTVDERFTKVTLDRFMSTFFDDEVMDDAAPITGIKSRTVVVDRQAGEDVRERRVRMRPAMSLPGPLRAFASDEQLVYDEVSSYDARAHKLRFYVDSVACDRLRYGGVMSFIPDGDGVRLHIDAVLQVDAPFVGGLVESLVQGGVKDGWHKLAGFLQARLDKNARDVVAVTRVSQR
jgi:hypothetical protein